MIEFLIEVWTDQNLFAWSLRKSFPTLNYKVGLQKGLKNYSMVKWMV